MEHDATVAIVVEGVVAALETEGESGLSGDDGANRYSAEHLVSYTAAAQEGLAMTEGKVVGAVYVDDVGEIKEAWPVTFAEIPE